MTPRTALLAVLILFTALPLPAAEVPADLAARKALLTREVRELRALEKASATGVDLLDQIVRAVPELLWLEEMTFRASQVRISGKALNTNAIAKLIESLDAVPAFDEPTLVDTAADPEDESYSFTLAFRLAPSPPEEGRQGAGVEALEQERNELRLRLARREDVPRVLSELRALAEDLDFGSTSIVEARTGDARTARIDVDLAATFHGLLGLFDRLKTLPALTTLDELTLRQELSDKGTLAASFRLRIPLRPAP